jgi:hypothetical protein
MREQQQFPQTPLSPKSVTRASRKPTRRTPRQALPVIAYPQSPCRPSINAAWALSRAHRTQLRPLAVQNCCPKFFGQGIEANRLSRRPEGVGGWAKTVRGMGMGLKTRRLGCQCDPAAACSVIKTPMIMLIKLIACPHQP